MKIPYPVYGIVNMHSNMIIRNALDFQVSRI